KRRGCTAPFKNSQYQFDSVLSVIYGSCRRSIGDFRTGERRFYRGKRTTSEHVLHDKGKPVVRRGRKAMGPAKSSPDFGGLPGHRTDGRIPCILMGPVLVFRRARVFSGA